ncbi:MAG: hypothetical protein KatS3mg103_0503 [Phycisphaerales bacterium]|nr:MAG: hypothetical protein KatS3mg103_0503 [Phycisphaerales bacterium]
MIGTCASREKNDSTSEYGALSNWKRIGPCCDAACRPASTPSCAPSPAPGAAAADDPPACAATTPWASSCTARTLVASPQETTIAAAIGPAADPRRASDAIGRSHGRDQPVHDNACSPRSAVIAVPFFPSILVHPVQSNRPRQPGSDPRRPRTSPHPPPPTIAEPRPRPRPPTASADAHHRAPRSRTGRSGPPSPRPDATPRPRQPAVAAVAEEEAGRPRPAPPARRPPASGRGRLPPAPTRATRAPDPAARWGSPPSIAPSSSTTNAERRHRQPELDRLPGLTGPRLDRPTLDPPAPHGCASASTKRPQHLLQRALALHHPPAPRSHRRGPRSDPLETPAHARPVHRPQGSPTPAAATS